MQITIINLSEYGKWTHSLGVDRESALQVFQNSIYATTQSLFSEKNCIVFPSRFDEMFAITNNLSIDDHRQILKKLGSKFPISFSMTIGRDKSPFMANENAFNSRKSGPIYDDYISGVTSKDESVSIIHIDVEGFTEISNKITPFETASLIQKIHYKAIEFFLQRNSLTFYMGGDNFIIVSDEFAQQHAIEFEKYARNVLGISVNCGIGITKTGREAVTLATASLDMIRKKRNLGKKNTSVLQIAKI